VGRWSGVRSQEGLKQVLRVSSEAAEDPLIHNRVVRPIALPRHDVPNASPQGVHVRGRPRGQAAEPVVGTEGGHLGGHEPRCALGPAQAAPVRLRVRLPEVPTV